MSALVLERVEERVRVHPLQPVAACLEQIGAALAGVPGGPVPVGGEAGAEVLEVLIAEATRVQRALAELRLRLARAAESSRVEMVDASTGTDAWLARLTGTNAAVMRGGLWLARLLEERYPAVRAAFASGDLGETQVRIIVRAAERMPAGVSEAERTAAVESLVQVAVARRMKSGTLRRRARRMLDGVAKAHADRHEASMVAGEEDRAREETWFSCQDNGDGTWSGRFVIPDLHAHLLNTVLEHLCAPRRTSRDAAGQPMVDVTVDDASGSFNGMGWSERMGHAFTELCEHLPTDGLAQHGRVGAVVAVHLDHQHLLDGLGAAHLDSGGEISAGQARRLACGAGLVPMVFAGASLPLDVGRGSRLHTKAQRLALSAAYDTCAAQGCERPFAWCEVHHRDPWALGGATDLSGVPLCGWHHRRAHDARYDLRHLTSGEVRFRRRP